MQIVLLGNNLHEMLNIFFWKKYRKKDISKCHLPVKNLNTLSVKGKQYWTAVFTLGIGTPQHLTILVLKFEPVEFTTQSCV